MHLILFGFPGCGKTHFGKKLAKQLGRPFIDTDDLLCALYEERTKTKLSVREIYKTIGEAKFRKLEQQALKSLAPKEPSVVALGGGTVLQPSNVAFLRKFGTLFYLNVPFEKASEQLLSRGIPSFTDPKDPVGSLKKLYQERAPIYESISPLRIPHGL